MTSCILQFYNFCRHLDLIFDPHEPLGPCVKSLVLPSSDSEASAAQMLGVVDLLYLGVPP